uniref:Tumor protein p63-regulated gene 1-like protein n=1 Tax=Sinocyclocheilus anshuiensis TaxID=1608454 RepID=A0A671SMB4_9TELE
MSEKDEEIFKSVDLEQQTEKSPEPDINPQESPSETEIDKPSTPSTEAKAESTPSTHTSAAKVKWTSSAEQFKLKRFFVLRPGTLDHGMEDVKALVNPTEDGAVQSVWLMAEREGEGVRVFWDKLREPSFTSRWNPFSVDYPFTTFTYHPVKSANEELGHLCDIQNFREQLTSAAQKAHSKNPVPGKANGVLLLNQPILVEAYVGLMSVIGNQNKLGYCLARGNIGF